MMDKYVAPPGRPQASPPDVAQRAQATREQWAERNADPEKKERHSRRMSEGQRAAHVKQQKLWADECDKLNLTETRGRWFTLPMLVRATGWAQSTCSAYLRGHQIDFKQEGRYYRSLLPTALVPAPGLKPRQQERLAPLKTPEPAPAKRRIGTTITRIEPDEVEELLREALGNPDVTFEWDRGAIIAKEPR